MAAPTKEQVQKLEYEHKLQLYYLLAANRVRINAFKMLMPVFLKDKNYKNSAKYKALQNYSKQILLLYSKWKNRQFLFEKKGNVPKFPDLTPKLFNEKAAKEIEKIAIEYINGKSLKGLGIIPLIIWGVIALIAAFTAVEIIDETTETNEEREDLLAATKKFAIDMKLTPEQTTAIVQGNQAAETAQSENGGGIFGGGTIKIVGLIAALYFGSQIMNKNKSKANG